jgi:hypothetical protein
LRSKTAHPILNTIVADLKKGSSFSEDGKYEDILEGLLIAVRKVHATRHEMYLADALSHCRLSAKILIALRHFTAYWSQFREISFT